MESTAGGNVCSAAFGLCRFSFPAGSAQGAGRGAGQAGVSAAGVGTELQAASTNPARLHRRASAAEEAPPQQTTPGGKSNTKPRQGHADADDILHGSCQSLC